MGITCKVGWRFRETRVISTGAEQYKRLGKPLRHGVQNMGSGVVHHKPCGKVYRETVWRF